MYESTMSHVFSEPKPIMHSRETNSPSIRDDSCCWKKKKSLFHLQDNIQRYLFLVDTGVEVSIIPPKLRQN